MFVSAMNGRETVPCRTPWSISIHLSLYLAVSQSSYSGTPAPETWRKSWRCLDILYCCGRSAHTIIRIHIVKLGNEIHINIFRTQCLCCWLVCVCVYVQKHFREVRQRRNRTWERVAHKKHAYFQWVAWQIFVGPIENVCIIVDSPFAIYRTIFALATFFLSSWGGALTGFASCNTYYILYIKKRTTTTMKQSINGHRGMQKTTEQIKTISVELKQQIHDEADTDSHNNDRSIALESNNSNKKCRQQQQHVQRKQYETTTITTATTWQQEKYKHK